MTVLTLEIYRNDGDELTKLTWDEWGCFLGDKPDPHFEMVEAQADSYADTMGKLCAQMVFHGLMYSSFSAETAADDDMETKIDFNEWLRIIGRALDVVELPDYIDLFSYRVVDEGGRVRSSGDMDLKQFICVQASGDADGGWCMFENVDWDLFFQFVDDNGGELNIEEYIRGYEYRYQL